MAVVQQTWCMVMVHGRGSVQRRSTQPFIDALGGLLREQQQTGPLGAVNLRAFFAGIPHWSYEHLRKMVIGERTLTAPAIEAMAGVLGVAPDYFAEYRIHRIAEAMKTRPDLVDAFYDVLVLQESEAKGTHKPRRGKK